MFLEHVNMTVADLDRTIEFYRSLLGFEVRWRGKTGDGNRAAHVGDERCYLALFEGGEQQPVPADYAKLGLNHFGLVVEDVDDMRRKLVEIGIEPHLEASYEPGRRLYFMDLNGVEVELVEYPGQSGSGTEH